MEPIGDRQQELVLIGMGLDEADLRARLAACLLTDDEMRLGPAGWATFNDPFPSWMSEEEVDDEETTEH